MKKKKSQSAKWIIAAVAAAVVLAVVIIIVVCSNAGDRPEETNTEQPTEAADPVIAVGNDLSLGDGLTIRSVTRYAGYYVEDGSNDVVSGIAAVRVRNNGDKNIQLLSFKLTDIHGQEYAFMITTLLPGEEVLALEMNRRTFDTDTKILSASVDSRAYFTQTPTLYPDQLSLTCTTGFITVENVSSETVPAGYVYYKNVSDGLLIGGITYRSSFRALAPGEKITLSASHYTNELSRVIFITYVEQ